MMEKDGQVQPVATETQLNGVGAPTVTTVNEAAPNGAAPMGNGPNGAVEANGLNGTEVKGGGTL